MAWFFFIGLLLIMPNQTFALTNSPAPWARELCGSSAQPPDVFAYITNRDDNTVSIIDVSTRRVIKTLDVAPQPRTLTVTPNGREVYVTTQQSVTVISAPEHTLRATVQTSQSFSIAAHPNGRTIYLGHSGDQIMSALDTETLAVSPLNVPAILDADDDQGLRGMVVHPNGRTIYVTNRITNELLVVSVASGSLVAAVSVGRAPFNLAIHPNGATVYVSNIDDDSISLVDVATNRVMDTVRLQGNPSWITFDNTGRTAYVANGDLSEVIVMEALTLREIKRIQVGESPRNVALDPDGMTLYTVNRLDETVSVVDLTTDSILDTIPVGRVPVTFGHFLGVIPR